MTNAPYYIRGADKLPSDSRTDRWAKRLIAYQQGASTSKKWDYKKGDSAYRILQKLASSVYGQNISLRLGVKFGQGPPKSPPKAPYINRKVYVQKDSLPPYKVHVYYGGTWHW